MSKRPAFQFYPADWRKDQSLRLCSAAARALWIDMLCLMHEGEPYGHLTALGRPMQPAQLAKLIGENPVSVKRWLAELVDNGVCSQTEAGVLFSRRMVRDEEVRELRAAGGAAGAEHGAKGASHGHKGGRPPKPKGPSGGEERGDNKPPLEPPPSTSSAASKGSEDKSSGRSAEVVGITPAEAVDLNAEAWRLGVNVLVSQGSMAEKSARTFFGGLLKGIQAKDLMPAISQAALAATKDPQGYLYRAAHRLKGRGPSPALEPQRVGFV